MNHATSNPPCCSYHQATHTPQKLRSLGLALVLIISFAAIELGIAGICHSIALLAEAGHMLSDGLSLGVAVLAVWIAQRPPSNKATFGHRRIEILAALLNGIGLFGIAVWIGWEAVTHLQMAESDEILSLPMLVTALIGLVVNGINVVLLHRDSQHDLNLRGAWLHMLADVVSSIGVMVAALLIWALGWQWADGMISLVVASLIAATAIPLIRQSLQILLEQAPPHLDLERIRTHLHSFEGVVAVHNLRLWTIALGQDAVSAHLTVCFSEGSKRDRLLQQMQLSLQTEFGIAETFLQLSAGVPLELMPSLAEQIEKIDGQYQK